MTHPMPSEAQYEPCGFHEKGDPACACYERLYGPVMNSSRALAPDEERAIREDALDPRTMGLSVGMVRRLLATLDRERLR